MTEEIIDIQETGDTGRMKVSCLPGDLSKALRIVGRVVSPRSTLPVLGNILLATDAGRLKLSATNLEVGINCWIGAGVGEDGATTVPARTFIDLVKAMSPEQVDMELVVRTQTLNMRAGRSEANVKGIDAQEFPLVPMPEGEGGISIEPDVLRTAIKQVAFIAPTDGWRPILGGVLAEFENTHLTLVAADGIRLSVRTIPLSQPVPNPFSIIIPARALIELGRISGEQKEPIVITVTPTRNQVLFQLTDIVLASQLLDGNFPDYQQIIPRDHTTHTVVDTAVFLKACKTALIFAQDGNHTTRLHIKPGSELAPGHMIISATSDQTGDDVSELDASIEGEEIEFALNVEYLIDVLSVINAPQVILNTTTPTSTCIIRPLSDVDFTHALTPLHLGR